MFSTKECAGREGRSWDLGQVESQPQVMFNKNSNLYAALESINQS